MRRPRQGDKFGALVATGKRIDHPEDITARKQRELGAAFNRMSSDNDIEAHNAFERAREITRAIGTTFAAIHKASREALDLQEAQRRLGKQLKQVMQENARYRAMKLSYKLKGQIVLAGRLAVRATVLGAPLVVVGLLYLYGSLGAGGAALLLLPLGLYNVVRGMVAGQSGRLMYGLFTLLAGLVINSIVASRDAPFVQRKEMAAIENMNRDRDLGPKNFTIDYPLSRRSMIVTVLGTENSLKLSVEGAPAPLIVNCARYYANGLTVSRSERDRTAPPEVPDIFHTEPVVSFGACDLYDKLLAIH